MTPSQPSSKTQAEAVLTITDLLDYWEQAGKVEKEKLRLQGNFY